MKIIVEHYGHKYTFDEKHDDQSLADMIEIFTKILRCMGYVYDGELTIKEEL